MVKSIEGNFQTFSAAAAIALESSECFGTLSLSLNPHIWKVASDGDILAAQSEEEEEIISPSSKGTRKLHFVLKGSLLYYFQDKDSKELVGCIAVSACEGYLRDADDTCSFDLECEGWSATLTADTTSELLRWCVFLSVVCKKPNDESNINISKKQTVRSSVQDAASMGANMTQAGMLPGRARNCSDARVTMQKFSSLRGYEFAVNLSSGGITAAEILAATGGSGESDRPDVGSKLSNSLDKMYDWEVNWRKLKLLEEQEGKPVEGMEDAGLLKRLQSKLGNRMPTLSPPISVEPDLIEIEELVKDSPRFQNQLAEWDREAAIMLEAAKKMIKSAENFLRANEEAVSAGQALSSDIEKFGATLGPQNNLKEALLGSSQGISWYKDGSVGVDGYHCVLGEWKFMSQELLILRTVLDEQLQATFVQALKQYFQSDVRGMRKNKQDYETARNKYASTLQKYLGQAANISENEKGKLQIELMTLKEKVATVGYSLYQQVVAFRHERHLVLLEYLFYFMSLHTSFFHQGYNTMKSNEADVNKLREIVQNHRKDARERQANIRTVYLEARERSMQSVAAEDMLTTLAQEGSNVKKEGWLIKLSNSQTPGLQRWKRKWFVLENGRLCYRKDSRTTDTKGNIDMMLTTVKLITVVEAAPSIVSSLSHSLGQHKNNSSVKQRAFTFEVICANPQVNWQIQAESEQDKREWVHALQTVTANLLGISVPHAPAAGHRKSSVDVGRESVHEMGSGMSLASQVPAFAQCVECSSPAEWASINLGVTLCLECSGAHRSLGSHISKVRSLAMDSWPLPLLNFMKATGNACSKEIWEGNYKPGNSRGTVTMLRPQGPGEVERKKQWCVEKYVKKRYLSPIESEDDVELGSELHAACKDQNLEAVMLLMAHGADVNFVNEEDYNRTPVHTSVIQAMQIATKYDMDEIDGLDGEDGIVSKERAEEWKYDRQASINILECLALHSADLNTQDSHGRTPMHYAADDERGSHIMHWLVVRKARTDICDTLGRTAAHVAMIRGNETGVLTAMPSELASADSPETSATSTLSDVRRSNFTRMISARGSDISVEMNGLIMFDDDGNEIGVAKHTNATSTSTEFVSDSSDGRASIPMRPPPNPPPAPPRTLPKPWQDFVDVNSAQTYYFNPISGETTWDFPTADM